MQIYGNFIWYKKLQNKMPMLYEYIRMSYISSFHNITRTCEHVYYIYALYVRTHGY